MALVFLFLFSFIFIQALLICSSRQLSMGTPSFLAHCVLLPPLPLNVLILSKVFLYTVIVVSWFLSCQTSETLQDHTCFLCWVSHFNLLSKYCSLISMHWKVHWLLVTHFLLLENLCTSYPLLTRHTWLLLYNFGPFSFLPNAILSPLRFSWKVLRTFFLEHTVLYQEFFIQELFTVFQKGNPVPWAYIPLRSLTSCCQWPVSSFSSGYVLSWPWLEPCFLWYLSFKYLIFRLQSPILPSHSLNLQPCQDLQSINITDSHSWRERKGCSSLLPKTRFHNPLI